MTTPPRTNFGFVGLTFPRLLAECRNAEAAAVSNPRGSLFQVRYVAEQIVRHICAFYDLGTEGTFVALAGTREFRSIVPQSVQDKIHAVRRIGNVAAHGSEHLDSAMAVRAVSHLYDLMVWAAANVSDKGRAAVPTTGFDEQILWDAPKQKEATTAELKKLERELENRKTEALQLSAERETLRQEREQHLREQERFKAKAAADAEEYAALKAELEQLRKELAAQTRDELVAARTPAGCTSSAKPTPAAMLLTQCWRKPDSPQHRATCVSKSSCPRAAPTTYCTERTAKPSRWSRRKSHPSACPQEGNKPALTPMTWKNNTVSGH